MRAIHYRRPGFKPSTLLTSLIDAKKFPAQEIRALYHERWEIELGYDEVKTDMLDRQEAWAAASSSPGAIPKNLRNLREELKRFIFPPRRSDRKFPRAVKIKMSNYGRSGRAMCAASTSAVPEMRRVSDR